MTRTNYSRDELLAEHDYATRLKWQDSLFHGGLDSAGQYLPPRSRHRPAAIAAWTEQLKSAGQPTRVMRSEDFDLQFFPNVEQAKLLLRCGARGAMTRILTLIGITEGFGNDGIALFPRLDFSRYCKEPVDGTCLQHLDRGLFEAHGNDEAGRGEEIGHDGMWYAIRDAALENPEITPDMWENLPIAPPPGYSGPAKAAPEAIGVAGMQFQFPTLDPMLEALLMAMSQLLFIEIVAFGTFAWAKEVLADPACSAAPDFAPRLVDYISADEAIHVSYLQCALGETRARTLVANDGVEIPGATVIDRICERITSVNRDGARRDRLLRYRMRQIREELGRRPDGDRILHEFATLGPVPQ